MHPPCRIDIPTVLGSEIGVLGHLWSQNDVIMSWLRLTATSNCFPPSILDINKAFEHIDMLFIGIRLQPYTVIHPTWLRFWHSRSLRELKWCHYFMVEADSHLKLLPASILDIYKVFKQIWYAVHGYTVAALHSHTHTSWLSFWGFGSFMELKWCHYVMVEADSYLNCFPHLY